MFTPGRSNFGLLMSESEQSEVSDNEQSVVEEKTAEPTVDQNAGDAEDADDWGMVAKKTRNPSSKAADSTPRREHFPNKTVFIGNGTKKFAVPGQPPVAHIPVSLEEITAERALELYAFPSKYRTSHLRKFVESAVPDVTSFRLKWQNDSSCWVVFDKPEMLQKALEELHDEVIQVRPFAKENLVITAEQQQHAEEPKPQA